MCTGAEYVGQRYYDLARVPAHASVDPLPWCRERACDVYTEIKLRLFTKMSISFNLSAYSILL